MRNLLVIYYYAGPEYPPRTTVLDHLYALERYSGERCFYLNLAVRGIPKYLLKLRYDLIVFHTLFLATRWNPARFRRLVRKVCVLKNSPAVKVAIPQDEFLQTDVLCEFISEFQIDCIYSSAPESEWGKIYSRVNLDRMRMQRVLTGYVDERTVDRIAQLGKGNDGRTTDIGYRAWRAAHKLEPFRADVDLAAAGCVTHARTDRIFRNIREYLNHPAATSRRRMAAAARDVARRMIPTARLKRRTEAGRANRLQKRQIGKREARCRDARTLH